ncbi:MAG: transposase [Verrucomicrobiales bacterium]
MLVVSNEKDEPEGPEDTPSKKSGSSGKRTKRETRAQRLPDHLPVREEKIIPLAVHAEPEAPHHPPEIREARRATPAAGREPGATSTDPKRVYGPGLLADIALDRYLDHLRLYGIEQRFLRLHGVKLPRQTMSDNLAHIADSASLVVAAMERELWAVWYVQADETPIRCLDPERPGGSFRGYLWTVNGPPDSDVIFRLPESRGHEVFKDWLPSDFRGVVQRDGYSAYATVARQCGAEVAVCRLLGVCPPQVLRGRHCRRPCFRIVRAPSRIALRGGNEGLRILAQRRPPPT